MGQTFAEKILSKANGTPVRRGDVAVVEPDFCMSHENGATVAKTFNTIGLKKVWNPEKIVLILDHTTPANSTIHAEIQRIIREFAHKQGITHFFDLHHDGGVCHQIMCQEGFAAPGLITVGTDSHTCTHGAMGSFSTGVGSSDMAAVWATGQIWFLVPDSIKIIAHGSLPRGVFAKDFILRVIGDMGADGADYRSVEFHGPGIEAMSVSERMTICNMGVEMGAKNAVCKPDAIVRNFLAGKVKSSRSGDIWADADATYERTLEYDLSTLEPGVAKPCKVDNHALVSSVAGTPIDQAFLGTCTNARLEDLRIAADILRGKRVAVRTLVYPVSRGVLVEAMKEGIIQDLVEAGCTVNSPGCGPCAGVYGGLLAPGEVCISTANRNFNGRMGSKGSDIYLASPATVAWSAVQGKISDPREALS